MEKRETTRVSIIAEVTYSVGGVGVTKRVTDLSEGGLFIETPVPVGVGTEMRVRFILDGQPVSAEGRVIYTQPYVGMGIEFTGISDLGRLTICEYVASQCEEVQAVPV